MSQYKIWDDNQEQWDANDIDEPRMVVEARSASEAAKQYADRYGDSSEAGCIVRFGDTDEYYRIEVIRTWEVDMYKPVTLAELCEP